MRLASERRACAALGMGFFALVFALNGIGGDVVDLRFMFLALAAVYLTAFFGLVAGWFWARWYTLGISMTGVIMTAILWWQQRHAPPEAGLLRTILLFGVPHAVAGLSLLGDGMAALYDGRHDWRERFRLDDNGVNRLGKAILRAGASLPYLVIMALYPREGMGSAVAFAALVMGAAGLGGLVRLRTWGLGAVAAAALLTVATIPGAGVTQLLVTGACAPLLVFALAPFAPALWRAMRA